MISGPHSDSLPAAFRVFVASKAIVVLAEGFFAALLPWMALSLTRSTFLTGIIVGIAAVSLMTSFVIGGFIDKSPRKSDIFALSILGIGLTSPLFLFAFDTSYVPLVVALIIVPLLIRSYLGDIQTTVSSYLDKVFLETDNQLKTGVSLRRWTSALANALGIGVFGFFVTLAFSYSIFFLISAYAGAFLIYINIRKRIPRGNHKPSCASTSPAMALKRFLAVPFLRQLTVVAVGINLFFGMMYVGFSALIMLYFGFNGVYYTFLVIAWISGTIVGNMLAGHMAKVRGNAINLAILAWGLLFTLFFLSSERGWYDPLLPIVFSIGLISGLMNVTIYGLMIKHTDVDLIGSTMGSFNSLFGGVTFFSGMVAGLLLTFVSPPVLFLVMGVTTLGIGVVSSLFFRSLRQIHLT